MKYGALILSFGGSLAALVQTLGYVRLAGAFMLAANVLVIAMWIVNWFLARTGERMLTASGAQLDRLGELFNVKRLIGEPDTAYRRRITRYAQVRP